MMSATVALHDVIEHMQMLSDEHRTYLNRRSGEFISLSDEEFRAAEAEASLDEFPQWQRELIEKAGEVLSSDDYLPLPSKFDIHEYRIMEDFCHAIEEPEIRERLLNKIRGRGAFGRFKQAIYALEREEEWYRFRDAALERIAVDWLEENGIAYHRRGMEDQDTRNFSGD
jgi:hypothetical protein